MSRLDIHNVKEITKGNINDLGKGCFSMKIRVVNNRYAHKTDDLNNTFEIVLFTYNKEVFKKF